MKFRKKKLKKPEPPYPTESQIARDMVARGETIRFDLRDKKWVENPERFWSEFKHTGEIRVPEDFEDWLIGQEGMKETFYMNLEEWVRKRKDIEELRKKGHGDDKDIMRRFLKERPGPYLLFIGEPGTGKSLLIKIANARLKVLYKKYGIKLQDVMLVRNPRNHQKPLVRYVPQGLGRRIREYAQNAQTKSSIKMTILKSFLGFVMFIGILLIMTAVFLMTYFWLTSDPDVAWFAGSGFWLQYMLIGAMLLFFPLLVLVFLGFRGGGMGLGKPKSENEDVPCLLVDNHGDPDLFVDMTVANPAKMFGSVSHDPFQSGGLGTPTHHRMNAGAIHEADGKILYADEFKNFLKNPAIVTEFLTPLEDGSYPIRGRAWQGAEGNASLAGETAQPIDCAFFLIAAANYDALPLLNEYSALRSRFSYGDIVRADDEIDATPKNEVKIAQFLADEAYRFRTPPVCSSAVKVVIAHARRKGSSVSKMKLQMRPYIQDLKKAAQIVWTHKDREWKGCPCGVNSKDLIHYQDMVLAIDQYAKPIEQQILDSVVDKRRPYRLIRMKGTSIGTVNGLVVFGSHAEGSTGDVINVGVWLRKVDDQKKADFVITGAPVKDVDSLMQNSIRSVRTAIYRMYGFDMAKEYYVDISILQTDPKQIDGPSAGITMTLALMSCLGDPRLPENERVAIPIRQDTAVTGTIENLGIGGRDVKVGPIGGVFEKTYGAKRWNLNRIIIPHENYDNTYFDRLVSTGVEVIGAKTVMEYFDLIRGDK